MGNLAVGRKRRKFFVLNLSNCDNDGEESIISFKAYATERILTL
jgi:hypothetical protein